MVVALTPLISPVSPVSTTFVTTGGDNDIIKIDGGLLNASIVGGAGNDSIDIIVAAANTAGSATNTYFFGSGGGKDTIDFGTQTSVLHWYYRVHHCSRLHLRCNFRI